jgi:hypothetical protein
MLTKIKVALFGWLHKTSIYKYVMIKIVPYIRFSIYYTSFTGIKYNTLAKAIKPGDVILCTDNKKLTTMLIPGEFSHAALCVSNDGVWETSEMNQYNYDKTTLFDICKMSDRVVLLRPQLPASVIAEAVERCKSFEDVDYDLTFTLNVSTLYCSELVYMSYTGNSLEVNVTDEVGLGKPYVSPIGLYNANKLKVIIDSDDISADSIN